MRDQDVKKVQKDFQFLTLNLYSLMNHNFYNIDNLSIETKNFLPFLFFRLNSNLVTRDDLIESTLAKQFNRRLIDDQACREVVTICSKRSAFGKTVGLLRKMFVRWI